MTSEYESEIRLFRTMEHQCGYFPDRIARDLVVDPEDPRLAGVFGAALEMGFRRSGGVVYRPDCAQCAACIAVRVDVQAFTPDRTQRRCLRRNRDLQITDCAAERTDEQFALYSRYLRSRHRDGGMDDHAEIDFDQFLRNGWTQTRFLEFRLEGALVAVAVTDVVDDGLSAVYTFFDPDLAARSLGTFAILSQIEMARAQGKSCVYLGYWIPHHPKMDYKRRFAGLEFHQSGQWLPMTDTTRSDAQ